MIGEFVKLGVRNIRHRGMRSWLTIIGVFIGIAAVVALVSLSQGLQNSVENEFESIGSDKLFINPGQSSRSTGSGRKFDGQDLSAVEGARGVEQAGGALFRTSRVSFQDESIYSVVLGMPTGDARRIVESSWAMEIDKGRKIRDTDRSNVVIGSNIADSSFEDAPGLRSQLTLGGKEFRVVGIMKPTGDPSIDGSVVLPISRAREVLDTEEDSFDWIFAEVQTGFTPSDVQENVEKALRNSRDVSEDEEDFTVSTQEDLIESFQSILGVVRGVVIGIASISLLVGAVGIMNTMFTSVTERTREIGVMKAIGATKRQIMLIFLIESGIIGMVGGLLGLVTGFSLAKAGSLAATEFAQIPVNPYISWQLVIGSLGFALVLGMASGVLPAKKASELEPAEALRYE